MEKGASATQPVVKTASAVAEVEEVEIVVTAAKKKEDKSCMKCCPKCKGKGDKCTCAKTEAAPKVAAKEKAEAESSGQPEVEAKLVNDPHADPKLKGEGKGSGKAKSEEGESSGQLDPKSNPQNDPQVKASSGMWVKLANLSADQKARVRKIWSKFWPSQFIDAALADR